MVVVEKRGGGGAGGEGWGSPVRYHDKINKGIQVTEQTRNCI